ncbi:thiol:disulfide interchange protein DsbA/DsbL [Ferrimonas lipolytica]|uniref:Thiol:disulfide interchange protein n=1 Tax=Ferrimonas lipolytica TaxID=2724191 RepID=A0A6H1UEE4_9GAMM|nr:thiol:disulfide interchange protein DsbA/DsbL [Ferrimonas lipolytica]QIZ77477.1 thiol:disulfide interchange protein DsbA/DsbL [Ferrimonas lipolytica]
MKKIIAAISLAISFGATAYDQGKHYIDLKDKGFNAPNQVVKVYSTNCPFCYKYEKSVIPNYEKNLPDGINYDAYHITTKPPFGLEKATAVAVGKVLGEKQYKTVKMAYYKQLHDLKKKFTSSEEATQFGIDKLGISQAEFDKHAASPEVAKLLLKWDQGLEVAKVKGIPAIVVNGKYLINTQSVTSMKMLDELTAELLAK